MSAPVMFVWPPAGRASQHSVRQRLSAKSRTDKVGEFAGRIEEREDAEKIEERVAGLVVVQQELRDG